MSMANTYLHQQVLDQPLFGDVLWNRPEQRNLSGKLAIVGGNAQGFSSVAAAYAAAEAAGAGVVRVLLPDCLKKTLTKVWSESEYAPSSKSGSLGSKALIELIELEKWADAVFISGDLGQNSETAALVESFVDRSHKLLTLSGDSVSIVSQTPTVLTSKELVLPVELNQLSHLLKAVRYPMAARSDIDFFQMAELIHSLTQSYPWTVITIHLGNVFVGYQGEVSTTPLGNITLTQAAAASTVWRMQQPSRPFEAMSSGVFNLASLG